MRHSISIPGAGRYTAPIYPTTIWRTKHASLDAVSANALVRLDRYISWTDILKLTENDPEAAYAAERLHTVLQHMGK
ncbi:MAG: hypothetical protein CVU31_11905 [Betaproteobacteria bacterium HGW-Betaproteobacteria-4]|nr:MAG: hypothetical protein CVU31_11905 [Betaproteobacteria bacterium HGW-Betaproteobacteria-4]